MIWLTKTTTTTRSAIIDMYAYTPASSSGSPTEALNVCLYSSLTWLGLGLGLGLGFGLGLGHLPNPNPKPSPNPNLRAQVLALGQHRPDDHLLRVNGLC